MGLFQVPETVRSVLVKKNTVLPCGQAFYTEMLHRCIADVNFRYGCTGKGEEVAVTAG